MIITKIYKVIIIQKARVVILLNYTKDDLKISASIIGAMVEKKSLDEALREVGLSEESLLSRWISAQSSDAAKEYGREILNFNLQKESGASLYLVKKVFCLPEEYESVAKAVSAKDTDKFKVLRAISSNKKIINYKGEGYGIEDYLVYGRSGVEAMRNTESQEPIFNFWKNDWIDLERIAKFDKLFSKVVYEHTLEDFKEVYDEILNLNI